MPYNRITVYNTYAELISVTVGVEEVQQMQRAWIEKFRAEKPESRGKLFLVIWCSGVLSSSRPAQGRPQNQQGLGLQPL